MILFSDFDNTLFFRGEERKTADNIKAIKTWRDANNQFCITTGRSYRSVTKSFPEIVEICDYFIVDSGSIILSKTGKLLRAFYFNPTVVADIVNFSKNFFEEPAVYYYTPDSEDVEYATNNITKLRLWFTDTSLLSSVAAEIRKLFPVSAFILEICTPDHEALIGRKGFVEIIPTEFGKSNAIKNFLQEKSISFEDIVTIGDGYNDYEMVHDFNGFAIEGSKLAETYQELKTVSSISSLINTFNKSK